VQVVDVLQVPGRGAVRWSGRGGAGQVREVGQCGQLQVDVVGVGRVEGGGGGGARLGAGAHGWREAEAAAELVGLHLERLQHLAPVRLGAHQQAGQARAAEVLLPSAVNMPRGTAPSPAQPTL